MAGSTGSGQDIESGRTNMAESTTVVQGGRPSELNVSFNGLAVFEAGARRDGDQRPDKTVSGVLGRGWNGADTPAQRQPGAGVIGVGAPNRGPGMVGLGGGVRIPSTFLGSPGNLGEDGLGGTGAIGIGGPGDSTAPTAASDVATDVPTLPGAGLVGQGGISFFSTPVAGSLDPGVGNGPGVVGVAGFGGTGVGVLGVSGSLPGVSGTSTSASGVVGTSGSGAGVAGGSDTNRGGWFSSGSVAQIHLAPLRTPLTNPNGVIAGLAGDLLVLTPRADRIGATLWFCTTTGDVTTASWVNVA